MSPFLYDGYFSLGARLDTMLSKVDNARCPAKGIAGGSIPALSQKSDETPTSDDLHD